MRRVAPRTCLCGLAWYARHSTTREAEKRADEQREAELRARFSGTANPGPTDSEKTPRFVAFLRNADGSETTFMKATMLFCTLYSFWMWWNLRDDVSKHVGASGIPGWGISSDGYAGWIALRHLVSNGDQRSVLEDFRNMKAVSPTTTLGQFLLQRYPQLLTGHRTSAGELLASLAAVHAHQADRTWVAALFRSMGSGDTGSKVDRVMDAMRQFHPRELAAGPPPPPIASWNRTTTMLRPQPTHPADHVHACATPFGDETNSKS